jgi:NAD(P)-dependent dehydrogenase (short-subunit alcohol dehydrogenase family)
MAKVVIITGAAGRIGAELTASLAKQGYSLLLTDINEKKLIKLKLTYSHLAHIEIFATNINILSNIKKLLGFAIKKFKTIDAAVYCAYPKSKNFGNKFEDLRELDLKQDLNNQIGSLIFFCQKLIAFFIKFKKGNLILISSIQGVSLPKFEHYNSTKMTSPIEYTVSKSAVISITGYLSKYFRNKNLRINCISPGGILDKQSKTFQKKYRSACNNIGLLNPKDIIPTILFLLSEESKAINGKNIIIDDGWTL